MKRSIGLLVALAACHPPLAASRSVPAVDAATTAASDAELARDVATDVSTADRARAAHMEEAEAYTDEAVVAALAHDPQWRFLEEDPDSHGCMGEIDPQSCTPNPCFEESGRRCRFDCAHTCQPCERACRATLVACLAHAMDETARTACARTGGGCIEACVLAKDRCLTGVCTPRQATCEHAQEEAFQHGPCHAVCQRCSHRCSGEDEIGACFRRCFHQNPGCSPGFQSICIMVGPVYGTTEPQPDP